jgi:hypothetical protein
VNVCDTNVCDAQICSICDINVYYTDISDTNIYNDMNAIWIYVMQMFMI